MCCSTRESPERLGEKQGSAIPAIQPPFSPHSYWKDKVDYPPAKPCLSTSDLQTSRSFLPSAMPYAGIHLQPQHVPRRFAMPVKCLTTHPFRQGEAQMGVLHSWKGAASRLGESSHLFVVLDVLGRTDPLWLSQSTMTCGNPTSE